MSKYVFSHVVDFVYRYEFDKCVKRYNGDYHVRELSCYNQFLHLLFGQLTACESLRDICLCLKAHKRSLFQLGFRQTVNESSLSRAKERRDVMDFYPNEIYVMDRAYVDFEALFRIDQADAFFVTRTKGNLKYDIIETNGNINEAAGLRGDHTIVLTGNKTKDLYPKPLRLVKAYDEEGGEVIEFVTNNMEISPLDVANLYRNRWNIEVFNKWVKQNLVIKKLWGHSPNAVKTHLWVAICAYLIVALIKAKYNSPYSITEVATLISVSALEKADLKELLTAPSDLLESNQNVKELDLFD